MSKSLGNSLLVSEVVKRWRPVDVRYYSGRRITQSRRILRTGLGRGGRGLPADRELHRARVRPIARGRGSSGELTTGQLPEEFVVAMNDDLAVPRALAVVHETVRYGNIELSAADSAQQVKRVGRAGTAMTEALGLDPRAWSAASSDLAPTVGKLADLLLEQRTAARGAKTSPRPIRFATNWSRPGSLLKTLRTVRAGA